MDLKVFDKEEFGKVRTMTIDVDEEDKLNNETLLSLGQGGSKMRHPWRCA